LGWAMILANPVLNMNATVGPRLEQSLTSAWHGDWIVSTPDVFNALPVPVRIPMWVKPDAVSR